MPKMRECSYCKGYGYIQNSLYERVDCQHCDAKGMVKVIEQRRSILVHKDTHKILRDLAYESKMNMVQFMAKIADELERKRDA